MVWLVPVRQHTEDGEKDSKSTFGKSGAKSSNFFTKFTKFPLSLWKG